MGVAGHPHQCHDRHEQQHTGGTSIPCGRWGGLSRVRAWQRAPPGARAASSRPTEERTPLSRATAGAGRFVDLRVRLVKRVWRHRVLATLAAGERAVARIRPGGFTAPLRAEERTMTGFIPRCPPWLAVTRRPPPSTGCCAAARWHRGRRSPGSSRSSRHTSRSADPASPSARAPRGCTWGCWPVGVRAGDEVIVPAFTFAGTANAVALAGATFRCSPTSAQRRDFCLEATAVEGGHRADRRHHAGAPVRAPRRHAGPAGGPPRPSRSARSIAGEGLVHGAPGRLARRGEPAYQWRAEARWATEWSGCPVTATARSAVRERGGRPGRAVAYAGRAALAVTAGPGTP